MRYCDICRVALASNKTDNQQGQTGQRGHKKYIIEIRYTKCSSYFYNHVHIKIRIASPLWGKQKPKQKQERECERECEREWTRNCSVIFGRDERICCPVVAVIFCYVANKEGGTWPAGQAQITTTQSCPTAAQDIGRDATVMPRRQEALGGSKGRGMTARRGGVQNWYVNPT